MRSITLRAWLLVLLSAGLQIFNFPTGGPMVAWRGALCWFALVPFFWALSLKGKDGGALSLRNSALLGYACGFIFYFGNCFWIYQTMYLYGGLPKPVAMGIVVLFSLYLGLYHALFAGLFAAVRKVGFGERASLLLAPFLWVAVELARGRITGFPWDLLGYTQVDHRLATSLAPLTGVMGISFLVVAVNAALLPSLLEKTKTSRFLAGVALVFALLVQLSSAGLKPLEAGHFATLLQENLSVGAMGREIEPESVDAELQSFTRLSRLPMSREPATSAPDLIVWPEAPSHLRSDDPNLKAKLSLLAREKSATLIVGSLGIDADPVVARGYRLYDSAQVFAKDGTYAGRYDKIHLVPWGEYVPFKQVFGFAEKLTEGVGNMDPGAARNVFRMDGRTYGVFICYESIFGDEVRQFARNGAEVLVNISDDGWYGETGAPWQHLAMARMRAIENDRWVLRSTNTGVTVSIDPQGRLWDEAPRHVRGAYVVRYGLVQATTFYTRHGDWFAWVCVLVSAAAVAGSLRKGTGPR